MRRVGSAEGVGGRAVEPGDLGGAAPDVEDHHRFGIGIGEGRAAGHREVGLGLPVHDLEVEADLAAHPLHELGAVHRQPAGLRGDDLGAEPRRAPASWRGRSAGPPRCARSPPRSGGRTCRGPRRAGRSARTRRSRESRSRRARLRGAGNCSCRDRGPRRHCACASGPARPAHRRARAGPMKASVRRLGGPAWSRRSLPASAAPNSLVVAPGGEPDHHSTRKLQVSPPTAKASITVPRGSRDDSGRISRVAAVSPACRWRPCAARGGAGS